MMLALKWKKRDNNDEEGIHNGRADDADSGGGRAEAEDRVHAGRAADPAAPARPLSPGRRPVQRPRDGSPALHPLALPDGPHLALTMGVGPAVASSVILYCIIPGVDAPGAGSVTQ